MTKYIITAHNIVKDDSADWTVETRMESAEYRACDFFKKGFEHVHIRELGDLHIDFHNEWKKAKENK